MPKSRGRKPKGQARARSSTHPHAPLRAALQRRNETFELVRTDVLARLPVAALRPGTTPGAEALGLLSECLAGLEGLGVEYAQTMGQYRWLYWLRRLPFDVMAGRLASTAPYRSALAEVLSTHSQVPEHFPERALRQVSLALTPPQSEGLLRMCGLSAAIGTLHSVLRRAGKGQSVRWHANELPWVVPDSELDAAIDLYDQRTLGGGFAGGTDMLSFTPFFSPLAEPTRLSAFALMVRPLHQDVDVPYWTGPVAAVKRGRLARGRFLVGGLSLASLERLLVLARAVEPWESKELTSLLVLLRGLFRPLWNGSGSGQIPEVGYWVLPTRSIPSLVDRVLTDDNQDDLLRLLPRGLPSSSEEVLADLAALETSTWPLTPGPVLRVVGEQTVVDVASASHWMNQLLAVPNSSTNQLVKARATHFEHVVQELIDNTDWAPAGAYRDLCGRELRLNGMKVTDIDALAVRGGTALFVSCKSIPHTPEYDAGLHKAVRNVRSKVEEADEEWAKRLMTLRASPVGDNYDLSGLELVGVVCIPFVAFTFADQSRPALAQGETQLRAVCSVQELQAFLSITSDDPL